MYSLITSLLIAILTESALIIRWDHIDKFIEEPLLMSFYDFRKLAYSEFNAEYKKNKIYYPVASKYAYEKYKDMDFIMQTKLDIKGRKRILYNSNRAFFFELCSNSIYFEKLLKFKLVKNETLNKAQLNVYNNKNATNEIKMKYLFQIGFEVGGNLLNYFWHPKEPLKSLINHYIQSEFKDHFVIGLQLRKEFLDSNIPIEKFKIMNIDDLIIDKFIECASNLERKIKTNKKVKWFAISDRENLLDKLNKKKSHKLILTNGTLGHVVDDPDTYFRAILDNELLSRCDDLIVSSGSSFGFVATLKRQISPLYIDMISDSCTRIDFGKLPTAGQSALI